MEDNRVKVKGRELTNLPTDLILDILFRLPVKSLVRLKCSCKFWYAIIWDPNFVDMHLTRALRNPAYLYSLTKTPRGYMYYAEQLSGNHIETTEIHIKRLRYMPRGDPLQAEYRSAGGLVAYHSRTKRSFYIWNPITGEKLKVPKGPSDLYCLDFGFWWCFCYCLSSREYKLVLFFIEFESSPRGRIYTLGSDNWRNLIVPFHRHRRDPEYVEYDETLFWILKAKDVDECITVCSFDINSENFRVWQGPLTTFHGCRYSHYLAKLGDAVACVLNDEVSHSVWILRDKMNGIWVKEYEFKIKDYLDVNWRCFVFLGLWIDGNLFGTSYDAPVPLNFSYDADNKVLKEMTVPFGTKNGKSRYFLDVFSHAASLVSPKNIMTNIR